MNSPPIVFFDLETRSNVDLKKAGLHRYARDLSTEVILISAQFPDGRIGAWAPPHRRAGIGVDEWLPGAWSEAWMSGYYFCAWNAQFDRTVMAFTDEDFPFRPPPLERTLCAQAQAENYSVPGKLENAGQVLNVKLPKDPRGKRLIRELCNGHLEWKPTKEDMQTFMDYCIRDTACLKEIWDATRKWTAVEWQNYWVLERINERGILVDIEFAEAATQYSADEQAALTQELRALTGDEDITLRHSRKKLDWLSDKLQGTPLEESMWTTTTRKRQKVRAKSAGRPVLQAIADRYDDLTERGEQPIAPDVWDEVVRFSDILRRGNSVAAVKFNKMVETHVDGRLYHQFRCSPTVTGRHAARGVQFDNVIRDSLPERPDINDHPALYAIDKLMLGVEGGSVAMDERVARLSEAFGLSISDILARLIRPTIIAPEGKILVWGDLKSIEAVVLPWLAGAEHYLEPFRNGEDLYIPNAVKMFGVKEEEVTKDLRLKAKVATLALGYQGGAGALLSMARGYGLKLTAAEAEVIKVAFRRANPWLVNFWDKLESTIWQAIATPGQIVHYRQIKYLYKHRDLYCFLPCNRPIVYPDVKVEEIYKERFDATLETVTYRKTWGGQAVRGQLYGGLATENITQGTAASLLHNLLRRLDHSGAAVWAPKHDEVLVCADDRNYVDVLKREMETNPPWAEGLPLQADVEFGPFYGK